MKHQAFWGEQGHQGYWLDSSFYKKIAIAYGRRIRNHLLYISNRDMRNQQFAKSDYSKA
jgi:hypothetical protein